MLTNLENELFVSYDSGINWTLTYIPAHIGGNVSSHFFLNNEELWLVTGRRNILKYSENPTLISDNFNSQFSEELEIFPNPSNGIFYIETPKSINNYEDAYFYQIYDNNGRFIKKVKTESFYTRIDLMDFPIGLYLINFLNTKDGKLYSGKLINK